MRSCMAEWQRHGTYAPEARARPERIDPQVFVWVGSLELWSGDRPRALRRLLVRGRLRPDRETAVALAWSLAAFAGPAGLRTALRAMHIARDAAVRGRLGEDQVYAWEPDERPRPLEALPAASPVLEHAAVAA
jgi:hypothetical protein